MQPDIRMVSLIVWINNDDLSVYITVIYFLSFVFLPLKRLYFVTPSGYLSTVQPNWLPPGRSSPGRLSTARQSPFPLTSVRVVWQGHSVVLLYLFFFRHLFTLKMACRFGRTRIIGNTVQILIRQHALCQWREGDHPYSFLLQQRQQVRFDPAIQHRITRLMNQARHTMFFQYGKCFSVCPAV